ncbi:hypothetical protein SAMN05443665_100274 [Actinomadura meyerae]|jgi:hypothetical protein|uniref:Uncharacterized protein n=1 Tax=Actinomadura meyerae TaxID=240840 RepID=A0A239D2P0_9ACTN|nr:hypothetical protein [Actinomadura meyerae]SNS26288.1 hypothetical protein SAMN05443665_100274 [Actinomadura meyerae]
MDVLLAVMLRSVYLVDSLLMDSRQVIGLVAAFLAALLAAQLGWHGTDRLLAWRQRSED